MQIMLDLWNQGAPDPGGRFNPGRIAYCPNRRAMNRPIKHTRIHVRDAPGFRARQHG